MRGAIVNVAAKDRSASYQVIQYDVDELTGTWQGMFSDGQMNYGLKDVIIEKQEDGTYLLSNRIALQTESKSHRQLPGFWGRSKPRSLRGQFISLIRNS